MSKMLSLALLVLLAKEGLPFCVPDGWQSARTLTQAVTRGSAPPSITKSFGDVIYSSSQMKVLVDENVMPASDGPRTTRIYDYPGMALYTVVGNDGDKNQTCTKAPLMGPFIPLCVPENSTMTHIKSYYGDQPPYVQFFMEFQGKDKGTSLNYRVSATYDVAPLFMQQWGLQGSDLVFRTSEFYNSTIWGSMPSNIFDPPKVCQHSINQTFQDNPVQERGNPVLRFIDI